MSEISQFHHAVPFKDGALAPSLESRDNPDFIFAIASMDTELQDSSSSAVPPRKVLMEQLSEAVANRFNNLMMAITSHADVELRKDSAGSGKRNWELVLSNATQATCLIQKLLFLGRKHEGTPEIQDLNMIVQGLNEVFQAIAGEGVLISMELNLNVGSVKADRSQLEYLLLSVIAAFCSSLTDCGTIKLTSEVGGPPKGRGLQEGSELSDAYAILSIEVSAGPKTFDLPEGFSDRATTLENKRLASALAASGVGVDEAQGYVAVRQGPGGSTKLDLYLLRLKDETFLSLPPTTPVMASTKTVLIVEDDSAVRRPASEFLKMEGFKVLQARNGAEALDMLQGNQSAISLLVTDINMAEMNGHELAERLTVTYPAMKVLFMSGDANKLHLNGAKPLHSFTMQKPFRLSLLIERIHDLLRD